MADATCVWHSLAMHQHGNAGDTPDCAAPYEPLARSPHGIRMHSPFRATDFLKLVLAPSLSGPLRRFATIVRQTGGLVHNQLHAVLQGTVSLGAGQGPLT
jgi:hypothetical protein